MFKKRKYIKNSLSKKKIALPNTKNNEANSDRTIDLLLACLHGQDKPVSIDFCREQIESQEKTKKQLRELTETLIKSGLVSKDRKGHVRITAKAQLYEATLSQNPKGFGFAENCTDPQGAAAFERDPFISRGRLFSARHGDRILIRVLRVRSDGRPEATVIKVIERGPELIAGIFEKRNRQNFVIPDDPGFPFVIKLAGTSRLTPEPGDIVIVKLLNDTSPAEREMPGELVRILGSAENVDTQMELVAAKYALPVSFSGQTLEELEKIEQVADEWQNRLDLRALSHITIDGETAKDFDDAVCVEKIDSGYRLHVSIADVSHYVRPGSAVDKDAYQRGTSVYFPGRVIPMLPEKLSDDLCSLIPRTDRLTVTAIIDYSPAGALTGARFVRSIIRSRSRFTYTEVAAILDNPQSAEALQYGAFLEQLTWMKDLALLLLARKKKRGAVDLNLAEAEITIDKDGKVARLNRLERNFAHQIIEEFMLAANEAVATHFAGKKLPALYRVHEPPNPLKADEFYTFTQSLGMRLAAFDNKPSWYALAVDCSRENGKEYIISNLILRTMQQARYSPGNQGHFGLALQNYTHFTSPIRRYPDLLVHRALLASIARGDQFPMPADDQATDLKSQGEHLSQRERTAMNAERDIAERLKIQYMRHHLNERFEAIISGVTGFCLYIELPELCVSGAIPVERLQDDYYIHDIKHHRLFGEITARTYQLGDTLKVQLTDIDLHKRRLNFDIVS